MHSNTILKAALSSMALTGSAVAYETHRVEVGNGGALTFNPSSTNAAVYDVIEFVFFPRNHSVVQSTFSNPCQSEEGFYSGFMPVAEGQGQTTFRVTVNDTRPIWFYCSQPGAGGHCAKGMVGCINCPTSGNTLDAFAAAAMMTDNTTVTQPAYVGGGVFAALEGYSGSEGTNGDAPAGTTTPPGTSTTAAAGNAPSSDGTNTNGAATPTTSTASGSTPSPVETGAAASVMSSKWTVFGVLAGFAVLAL